MAEHDFVVLTEESSSVRAHWIAGAIKAHDIPVHVVEDERADEFAMAQKLMGTALVQVLVPEGRLTEARTIFLNLSQPIPLIDDENEGDEEDDEPPPSMIPAPLRIAGMIFVALLVLGTLWILLG